MFSQIWSARAEDVDERNWGWTRFSLFEISAGIKPGDLWMRSVHCILQSFKVMESKRVSLESTYVGIVTVEVLVVIVSVTIPDVVIVTVSVTVVGLAMVVVEVKVSIIVFLRVVVTSTTRV